MRIYRQYFYALLPVLCSGIFCLSISSEEMGPQPPSHEIPVAVEPTVAEAGGDDDREERRPNGLEFLVAQQQLLSVDQESLRALALLHHGHDHRFPSRYRREQRAALERLQNLINDDGSINDADLTTHVLVAYFLAQAYGPTQDPALVVPVRRLVDHIASLAVHGNDAKGLWMAWPSDGAGDTLSIRHTFFAVMTLRHIESVGLNVSNHLQAARNWLERVRRLSDNGALPESMSKDFSQVSSKPSIAFGLGLLAMLHDIAPADPELIKANADAAVAALDDPAPALDEIWATAWSLNLFPRSQLRAWHNGVLARILAQQGDDGSWPAAGDGRWSDSISRSAWMLLILGTRPRSIDNPAFQKDE